MFHAHSFLSLKTGMKINDDLGAQVILTPCKVESHCFGAMACCLKFYCCVVEQI